MFGASVLSNTSRRQAGGVENGRTLWAFDWQIYDSFLCYFFGTKVFLRWVLAWQRTEWVGVGGNARITMFKSSSIQCIEIECRDGWEEVVEMTNKSKVEIGSASDSLENVLFNLISCGFRLRNFQFQIECQDSFIAEYIWTHKSQ